MINTKKILQEFGKFAAWVFFLFVLYDVYSEIGWYHNGWYYFTGFDWNFEWHGFPREFSENSILHFFVDVLGFYFWWKFK